MSDKDNTLNRRHFLGKSASAAGLTALAGLGISQSANAHTVEINAMEPTPEQVEAFMALPARPVVMVNLLKFKAGGGALQYARYGAAVRPLLASVGARVLFSSQTAMCVYGDADWDAIALAEYPSPQIMLQMISSPEYAAISGPRTAGLEGQVNYAVWQNDI